MVRSAAISFVLNLEIEFVLSNIDKWRPVVTVLRPFVIDAAAISDELEDRNRITWSEL